MEFYSFYNRPKRKRERFDNTKQKVYIANFDKKGIRRLEVDKEIDIYEKIQECAKDTGLTNIFSKYGLNIYDQLKNSEAQFVDLTNLPGNLMEAMDVIDKAQYAFDRQSKEIKAKFNNDFKQFIAASETGELAKLLNDELKVSAERFNTANMANFNNSISLDTHKSLQVPPLQPQQASSALNSGSQVVQPQQVQQTTNVQNGGVVNV